MPMFLRFVAEAAIEKGLGGLVSMDPCGPYAWGLAECVWGKLRATDPANQRAAIEQAAQATSDAAHEEGKQAAGDALAGLAGPPDPAEVVALELYLAAVPAAVRQSHKRPADPSGRSVPADLALRSAEDVLRLLPARPPRFRPGEELPQRRGWVLDRPLGIGGFGEVWLARNALSAKLVGAVKFCHGEQGSELRHEAAVIARLMDAADHPNLVKVRDACIECETPWLMFDYVDGSTLTEWIHAVHNLPPDERQERMLEVFSRLVDAVAFCHRLDPPLVHRDLKPANVLIDLAGAPRVTDFGIGSVVAKAALREEARSQSTRAGRLLTCLRGSHTPLYASPQQREGADPDPRDDVYALGVIGYQMLTGDLTQGTGADFADDLREVGATEELVALLSQCVAQKLERRPTDARALSGRLAIVAKPREVVVLPQTVFSTSAKAPIRPAVQAEWTIPLQGKWYRRPASDDTEECGHGPFTYSGLREVFRGHHTIAGHLEVDEEAGWERVCDTPSNVMTKVGEVYLLRACPKGDEGLIGLGSLTNLGQLHSLHLERSGAITDAGLAHLGKLVGLRSLNLSDFLSWLTKVTDSGLAHLTKLTGLLKLNISNSCFTDLGLSHIGNLAALQHLSLAGCHRISDAGLIHLLNLSGIRYVNLSRCKITNLGLSHITRLTSLQTLNLSGCSQIADAGMASLCKLSELRHLDLGEIVVCHESNGAALSREAPKITNEGLRIIKNCHLDFLDISGCSLVTDAGLYHLSAISTLQSVDLAGCTQLTDAGMAYLPKLYALRNLSLSQCDGITDAGLTYLPKIPRLRYLDLSDCEQITDARLAWLCAKLPRCRINY